MSLVKRFNFGDNTARFELISSTDHGHHHHLICKVCRTVVEIDECFDRLESKIAKDTASKTSPMSWNSSDLLS